MRPPLAWTARGGDGSARPDADVYVYLRGTSAPINVYAAATGGSPLSQPLTPDAQGVVVCYLQAPLPVDIVEDFGHSQTRTSLDVLGGVQDAWTAPTLSGAWVNFGGADAPAGYMLSTSGIVYLRGTVKSGAIGSSIFTLPAGYRPAATLRFTVASNGAPGVVEVTNAGLVWAATGNNTYVSLERISFQPEA